MKFTNREIYLNSLKEIQENNIEIPRSLINQLLIKANNFLDYTTLIKNFDNEIINQEYFDECFLRFKNGEPFEYIVNEATFVSIPLYVDKNVLIPRVETEGLMNIILKLVNDNNLNKDTIIDMCTGSGCIALYLKSCFKDSKVYATDISLDALKIASKNSKDLNLEIETLYSDKLEEILKNQIKCDIFVSNPPYVENKEDIEEKVIKYEPLNAVYIENNDIFYEECFKNYKNIMNDKFLMAFEINYDQKDRLTKLIGKYFKDEDTKFLFLKDFYNKDRYLIIIGGYDVNYFQM